MYFYREDADADQRENRRGIGTKEGDLEESRDGVRDETKETDGEKRENENRNETEEIDFEEEDRCRNETKEVDLEEREDRCRSQRNKHDYRDETVFLIPFHRGKVVRRRSRRIWDVPLSSVPF